MGQGLLSPLIISTLPHSCTITHLFIYSYITPRLNYFFCTILTPSMAAVVFPNNFTLRLFVAVFCPPGANHRPWLMRRAGFVSHAVMIGSGVREHWPLCANPCNSVTQVFHLRKWIKWRWMDKISPRDRKTWQVSGYEIPEMHLLIRLHSQADPIQP